MSATTATRPSRGRAAPTPEPVRPSEWRRTLGASIWAAGLTAAGAFALAGVWDSWLVRLALVLAAVLPLALLRGLLALRISRWVAAVVIAVLLVLVGYLMTAGAGTGLLATLSDAVPRLLTEPTPYERRADLLAAPVLLTGLVSVLAGLRIEPRTRVGPVAGALVLYLCGALLSGGASDPHGLVAVLLVVVAIAGWVLLDRRAETPRQRMATALPVLAVVGVALAAAAVVPLSGAFQPRDHVDPPITDVAAASPLPRLGAWASNPDAGLFRVTGAEVPLRLVTLRTHDGSQWQTATEYAPLGSAGARSLPDGDQRREVSVSVELDGLGGPWLPTPGDPSGVSDAGALVDLESGTLFDEDAGEGTRYQVTATLDAPDPQALVTATVPTGAAARPYLDEPALPGSLTTYADRVLQGATTPYERAAALEQAVENQRELSSSATSGSAYWRIEQFLLGEPGTPGARVGTSEQFATSFALLARYAGLPTRVVVGFRPGSAEQGGAGDQEGTRTVRGGDALAWPEVYFDRLGWVPFSPTPNDDTFDDGRPVIAPTPDTGGGSEGPVASDAPSAGVSEAPEPETEESGSATADPGTSTGALALGAAGLVAALLLVLVALRRWRSARHLRRGDAGAWAEVVDALTLAGQRPDPARSATDVADDADTRLGTTGARPLADRAERAAFGPDAPSPGQPGRTDELRAVRRAVRQTLPAWRRWWFWVDPRVLGR